MLQGGSALDARLIRQPTRDHAMHDASTGPMASDLPAKRKRKGKGKLNTQPYWARAEHLLYQVPRRLGMRPAPQLGHKPRFLQEKATRLSPRHCSHTTRKQP